MLNCPPQFLHGHQDFSQARVHHRLARVQTRDPRNGFLVLEYEFEHRPHDLAALYEARLCPLNLRGRRLRNGAVDAICGGGIDAPKGLSGRRSVALYKRRAGDL
jgi:hypothetical protein